QNTGATFNVTGSPATGVTANATGAGTNTAMLANAQGGTTNNAIEVNNDGSAANDLFINETGLTRNGALSINTSAASNALTVDQGNLVLGTEGASPRQGKIAFQDNTNNANTGTLLARDPLTGTRTWTLPDSSGTIGVYPNTADGFVYYGTTITENH